MPQRSQGTPSESRLGQRRWGQPIPLLCSTAVRGHEAVLVPYVLPPIIFSPSG